MVFIVKVLGCLIPLSTQALSVLSSAAGRRLRRLSGFSTGSSMAMGASHTASAAPALTVCHCPSLHFSLLLSFSFFPSAPKTKTSRPFER